MVKLKKICKGVYVDQVSWSYITRRRNLWDVEDETTGEVLFTGKDLKECRDYLDTLHAELFLGKYS